MRELKMDISPEELHVDALQQRQDQISKLSLEEVIALAERLQHYEGCIEVSEEYLSEIKKEYRELAEKTLPEAMNNLGINSLGLKDGSSIGLQELVTCSINEENREAAHDWLRVNGYGDLIKNEVIVSFGKGEDAEAELLFHQLKFDDGRLVNKQEKVHPSTLKAWVKERLKAGDPLPSETFKLFVGVAARVNKKKEK